MKKILSLMAVVILSVVASFAGEINVVMADYQNLYGDPDSNGNPALGTVQLTNLTLEFAKNNGSTAPVYNVKNSDARLYAKGTLTVTAKETITSMVFNLSAQGLKRAAEITPSTGSCKVDVEAKTVTWTGAALNVVLTVGDKAVYGSDGESKAGQFCFESIVVTIDADVEPSVDPQPSTDFNLADLEPNYAQGVYISNYMETDIPLWEIDLAEFINEDDYVVWVSFGGVMTTSASSVSGEYDLAEMMWSDVEIVNAPGDTTNLELVSGSLKLVRLADTELNGDLYYVYHVTIDVVDENGISHLFEADVLFDYFYDAVSDADIDITDEIVDLPEALEVVEAQNFVTVQNDALLVDAEGTVQVYNVSGQILYNGAGKTAIAGFQHGQVLIIRNGNRAAKVAF